MSTESTTPDAPETTETTEPEGPTFADLGLDDRVVRSLRDIGYERPSPIQAATIPALLDGRHVVGLAQTGTGKTAAFVLPLLHRIHAEALRPEPKGCSALILAPTRELANQIADSVRAYGRYTRPSIAVVIGGAKAGQQVRAMAKGVDVLVATPGRLIDLMERRALRLGIGRHGRWCSGQCFRNSSSRGGTTRTAGAPAGACSPSRPCG